ncbi:MAG: cytochrome c maturation protein CcmE [Pseudomonadota bacterium]
MASTRKKQRMILLAFGGSLMTAAAVVVGFAFQDTIAFFKSPSDIMAQQPDASRLLRIGGLVEEGTVVRGEGEAVRFDVTDGGASVTISFAGILPDLFREGQGIVAEGYWRAGRFEATEVLAKHDENYVPKEVADALKQQGHWKGQPPQPGDAVPAAGAAGYSGSYSGGS